MKILAIETSCDETALALLEANGDSKSPNFKVLNTALYSQVEKHAPYGGVFPALAKREHAKNLIPLLDSLLKIINLNTEKDLDIPNLDVENSTEAITTISKKNQKDWNRICIFYDRNFFKDMIKIF